MERISTGLKNLIHDIPSSAPPVGFSPTKFRFASFNMLAPCYNRKLNTLESEQSAFWLKRVASLRKVCEELQADVFSLQEFWFGHSDFQREFFVGRLKDAFHPPVFVQRANGKKDGVATLVNRSLNFLDTREVKMKVTSPGDRVASIITVAANNGPIFLLCNTHLTFPHNESDVVTRGQQIRMITAAVDDAEKAISHRPDYAGCFLVGDFNGANDNVSVHVAEQGFQSSYKIVNGHDPKITHLNHLHQAQCVDFIYFRGAKGSVWRGTPQNAFVFPNEVPDDSWPSEFSSISDHRPLVVDFGFESLEAEGRCVSA